MRTFITPLAFAVLALSSTLCAAQKPAVIGLVTKADQNPFFVKMKEGAKKAADAGGAKLLTAAGKFDNDNAGQVTAMENMLTAGANTILITPGDSKAIVPAIKKAQAKGVMVIALDSPTDPQDATDALFATNNYTAGVLIGRYAKAAMAGKTPRIAWTSTRATRSAPNGTTASWPASAFPPLMRRATRCRPHRRSCAWPTVSATSRAARPRWRTACRRIRASTSSTR
jgi:ABC-type sugar transport system substrate-binding protein